MRHKTRLKSGSITSRDIEMLKLGADLRGKTEPLDAFVARMFVTCRWCCLHQDEHLGPEKKCLFEAGSFESIFKPEWFT